MLDDVREGIEYVWRHVVLRTIITYWGFATMATSALIPALAYYITIDRNFGAELFGFIGTTWSVGYLLGSLLIGRLGGESVGLRMLASGGVIGTCLIAIAVTTFPLVYLVAGFCIGAALAVQTVSYMTLRPALTPDELLGRVGSTARTITLGLQPLGRVGGGALISAASGGVALIAMGGLSIGASLLFGLSKTFREAGHSAR
jgi:hypothetical protein